MPKLSHSQFDGKALRGSCRLLLSGCITRTATPSPPWASIVVTSTMAAVPASGLPRTALVAGLFPLLLNRGRVAGVGAIAPGGWNPVQQEP